MRVYALLTLGIAVAAATASQATAVAPCKPFPSTIDPFSGDFQQPQPPLIHPEFQTSFIQHKWDQNVSHITAGYIYNSPSQNLVRVYQAYPGGYGVSNFDYKNVTKDGLVNNVMLSYQGLSDKPERWSGYVNPDFLLIGDDFLVSNEAIFAGFVTRDKIPGQVAAWDILYQGVVAITLYVDQCNTLVGWDYFSPGRRTRVITEFFDISTGSVHV